MQENSKTYIFKVKLKYNKRVYRSIEILGNQTLDQLHGVILKAFDFDGDHLYSFFMNNKPWSSLSYEYCSPRSEGNHADKILIKQLSLTSKQKFLYLYDYGDEWKFEVEFRENGIMEETKKYPRVISGVGKSPEQYG